MHTAYRGPHRVFSFLPALCAVVLLAAGCAELTVGHLQKKTWTAGARETISGKFLNFDYASGPSANGFGVKGTAWPIKENLPPWADMVQNLSITAYLCDGNGAVLAQEQKTFPSQKLAPAGLNFDFTLKPKAGTKGPLFVSFGYSGMFTASKPPLAGGQGSGNIAGQFVFFASEGAVLKH